MNQDFAVYLIVGAAALYLVRLCWNMAGAKPGCGGCGKCSAATENGTQKSSKGAVPAGELIQIQMNGRPLTFAPGREEPNASKPSSSLVN